ncbi:MAG: hypothetical protein H7831_04630 [Magnetococcus sp. WYHC-3]
MKRSVSHLIALCGLSAGVGVAEPSAMFGATPFPLARLDLFQPGYQQEFTLSGEGSHRGLFKGRLRVVTTASDHHPGGNSTRVRLVHTAPDPQNTPYTVVDLYVTAQTADRRLLGLLRNDGAQSRALQTNPLPETATPGDQGILGRYITGDNATMTLSWTLKRQEDGLGLLELNWDHQGSTTAPDCPWAHETWSITPEGHLRGIAGAWGNCTGYVRFSAH